MKKLLVILLLCSPVTAGESLSGAVAKVLELQDAIIDENSTMREELLDLDDPRVNMIVVAHLKKIIPKQIAIGQIYADSILKDLERKNEKTK